MVFDPTEKTITALFEMNGKKGGYTLPMDEEHWPGLPQSQREYGTGPRSTLNYTEKTKEIEGHKTREVLAESEDYSAALWLAEDIELNMLRVLSYQSVGKGKSKKEIEIFGQFGVDGFPLEMHLKSKAGGADVAIFIKNISEDFNEEIFSSAGHDLMKLGE